ncbi:MAG: VOC family protein [Crocinitomicaceae bacterium]
MRINELTIYTSQLEKQVEFYSSILKLILTEQSKERASFQMGSSILTFESRDEATPYHFAINIPSNKEFEALAWLKERVNILSLEETEIHDFNSWNAKAVYFYDPDNNIVEFISRRNLQNESALPFDSSQLLCISEIGISILDIEPIFKQLKALSGVEHFSGDVERFLAIGDDHGLFIIVNKNLKDWYPTGDEAHSSDFKLDFSNRGNTCHILFENGELLESSEPNS